MAAPERRTATEASRRAWNASAAHHGAGPAWDRLIRGFAAPGFPTFDPTATACPNSVGIRRKGHAHGRRHHRADPAQAGR